MPLPLSSCLLRRLPVVVLGFVLNLALAACGSDKSAPPPAEPGPLKSGMFADHPVEGLEFSSGSAPVSLTDRQGTFSYRDGTPVSFAIGGIALGSEAAGAVTVTPLQLAPGAVDTTDPRVTNMARLLQTLDADCEVSNGIRLTPAVRSAGSGRSIDFDQTEAAFGSDTAVQNFLEAAGAGCRDTAAPDNGLVSGALARQRLGETLAHMESNGGRANRLPVALAGADFQVNEGAVASLAGAGADDDGSVTDSGFRWTQLSGPAVISGPVLTASFNFAAPAVEADTPVTLRLRVTDDDDGTHDDDLTITIRNGTVNDRPIADAGADQTVNETETVTLNGANSRDPEDGVNLSYQWTQDPDDPVAVTLSGADGPAPSFTAPVVAAQIRLHFTLIVRDSQNLASAPDTVTITVNNVVGVAPVADAGPDRTVDEGVTVQLDGRNSSDADGTVTAYDWTQTAGAPVTLTGANTATPSFAAPDVVADEDLTFRLTVTDNHGNTGNDSVTVRVLDRRVISIGSPAPVIEGDVGLTEVSFTVRLTLPAVNPVTVQYTTQDVTATAGRDYVAASGTLEFQAGEDEKTVTVNVIGDVFDENDETFRVLLFNATGASLGASAGAGTILDDDTTLINRVPLLQAGAAKRSITPTQQQIDGVPEARVLDPAAVGSDEDTPVRHLQKFNLGGFGLNPLQNVPDDPFGGVETINEELTEPATRRVFTNSQDVDEDTYVRAFVIEQPGGDAVVFVMIDAIGAGNVIQRDLKAAVIEATRVCGAQNNEACFKPENILFGQSHSHTAADLQGLWGGVPQEWIRDVLYDGAAKAVQEAFERRKPAHLHLRQGHTVEFNNYRRPRIVPGANADGTLTLLTATGDDLTAIGNILQYNAHPTSVGAGNKPRTPHSEYILGAMDWLESANPGRPGGTSLYYNGPIADASPSGMHQDEDYCEAGFDGQDLDDLGRPRFKYKFEFKNNNANSPYFGDAPFGNVRCRGQGIADYLLHDQTLNASRELAPSLQARSAEAMLPVTNAGFLALGVAGSFNRYYNFNDMVTDRIPGLEALLVNLPQVTPVARTFVSRITLGGADAGLEIVTIPGESTNTFGDYIRSLAKTNVMLLGLTHNSFGYILPEEEFSYLDQEGDDGLVAPFTGYEENVSLGPLTAPLLRIQAYNPLFDAPPEKYVPPALAECIANAGAGTCTVTMAQFRLELLMFGLQVCAAEGIGAPGCPFRQTTRMIGDGLEQILGGFGTLANGCREIGGPDEFCAGFDALDESVGTITGSVAEAFEEFARQCRDFGGPGEFCQLFDALAAGYPGLTGLGLGPDGALASAAADATLRDCDILDPSHCLFPFPSDHFTVKAAAGSPQARNDENPALGGTGLRINFNPLAMPRNTAGKPVDPSEWNRNDGYSPGQMILTYVPGLAANADGTIPGLPSIKDVSPSLDDSVLVLDAETGEPHPVWAETDLNAGMLLYLPAREFTEDPADDTTIPNPKPKRAALIIRPAKNFEEGRRYIVVLRNLKDAKGEALPAQTAFRVCRDNVPVNLPPVQSRCAKLNEKDGDADQGVFDVLARAGITVEDNASLYLAWDFTVASTNNQVARLRQMRDDAFINYLGQTEDAAGKVLHLGRAPQFAVTETTDFTQPKNGVFCDRDGMGEDDPPTCHAELTRSIRGRFTVPSYVVPADPSPLDGTEAYAELLKRLPPEARSFVQSGGLGIFEPAEVSSPPNRLFYNPADAVNPSDPQGLRYGDGLPDRSGEMTTTFTCRIARSTLPGKTFNDPTLTAADVVPARPSLYGHGLLGNHSSEINQDQLRLFGNEHNMMFCATDWFGFASGDLPNVVSLTLDVSNFPVLPDGTQQGILNQMVLARLLRHLQGFASDPAFQVEGRPVFTPGEVYYDGNSQGGITGGAVVALSKDIRRGVLGVPGMNYSMLLTRSVDFDLFSVPLYASYPDDLDRSFLFSMMQMLWDRSENNGYAPHMTNNAKLHGPDNEILLHPAFGDHQVTMWSAYVMANTIGAPADDSRINATRDDVDLYRPARFGVPALAYDADGRAEGSGLMMWDAPWTSSNRNCQNKQTIAPPFGNVPPRETTETIDTDPHECPRREAAARCQKSHFLNNPSRLVDVSAFGTAGCPALDTEAEPFPGPEGDITSDNGTGLIALLADFMQAAGDFVAALLTADVQAAFNAVTDALAQLAANLAHLLVGADASLLAALENAFENLQNNDPMAFLTDFLSDLAAILGLQADPVTAVQTTASAERSVEPVVLTGASLPAWSAPAAVGVANPYPSGTPNDGTGLFPRPFDARGDNVRSAHNGRLIYPAEGQAPAEGMPVNEIAAYRFAGVGAPGADVNGFVEIPVQVDERMPYFLANARSNFSTYSGTDPELNYVWDSERWDPIGDGCTVEFDEEKYPTADPVPGLDNDDEIVFMAKDAGERAPAGAVPAAVAPDAASHEVALLNPLRNPDSGQPDAPRFIYLFHQPAGSAFGADNGYVRYARDLVYQLTNAPGFAFTSDHWVDSSFFTDDDLEKLGTGNRNYGPNLTGNVCRNGVEPQASTVRGQSSPAPVGDRFPLDGVTVTTDTYRWRATGRWMVRDIRVRPQGNEIELPGGRVPFDADNQAHWDARADLIDRWKGRAFQQNPDSYINAIGGFEDEQVNWEANSILLGERRGPVRAIREVWGADSGTNVTKTETFYRDAVAYRYRVRVHPIPPDGLYTSWDYNRGSMVPKAEEAAAGIEGGRYFTQLRPQGVPVDGVNDDVGNVDGVVPLPGDQCVNAGELDNSGRIDDPRDGRCPMFFDAADPTFNLLTGFYNWEQVSGKGDLGSLVYLFEIKGETSAGNPLVVPYYRDDACFDDGTGDDPVGRPFPGRPGFDAGVRQKYSDLNGGRPYEELRCEQKQGAHGSHGVHYFFTHDTDNAFSPATSTETDGQQWQFMVPTASPQNIAEPYANVVRAPLKAVAFPRGGTPGFARELFRNYPSLLACVQQQDSDACQAALGEILTPDKVTACQPFVTNPDCVIGPAFSAALMALDDQNQQSASNSSTIDPDSAGNGIYHIYLPTASGEILAFTVFEPTTIADGSTYPLVLHGHGYGGRRERARSGNNTAAFIGQLNAAGYAVISFDQRGFGESSGTVRVLDPDVEGQDLVQMVDWAEDNLPWLKYDGGNLVLGSIGSSYGGGYQLLLLAVDPKQRLDALVPDITWNDLRSSLDPGRVVKSGWDLLLPVGGESGSQGQQDPFIKETLLYGIATNSFPENALEWFNYHSANYFCEALGEDPSQRIDVYRRASYPATGDRFPGSGVDRREQPIADVLLTQGMRDTLFNFNQAYANFDCLRSHGGDVRLLTHQSGHLLPVIQSGGPQSCGTLSVNDATLAWFDEKLKGNPDAAGIVPELCLSLAAGDAVTNQTEVTVSGTQFPVLLTRGIPNGVFALPEASPEAGPAVIELGTVGSDDTILAGIPTASLTLSHPVADHPLADPIIFVGVGLQRAGMDTWTYIDDQVQPFRGLGKHDVQLVGIAERLDAGDKLALLVSGFHIQYPESWSRDATTPAINIEGSVKLPIIAGNVVAASETPDSLADCLQSFGAQFCAAILPGLAVELAACDLEAFTEIRNQDAFENYLGTRPNCAYNALYEAIGVGDGAAVLGSILDQCADSDAADLCEQLATTFGTPDRLPLAAELLARGTLASGGPDSNVGPTGKSVNGTIADWTGTASRIGGTALYNGGEHIYSDYIFDAYGADDGDDARRLAALLVLAQLNSRTGRVDQLFQAAGDQFGAPEPVGMPDHYGDAADLEEGADLTEVRWASDGVSAFFLARVTRLLNPENLVVLVLADRDPDSFGMSGLNAGLTTRRFDQAYVLRKTGSQQINLLTGATQDFPGTVSVSAGATGTATEYDNALEARVDLAELADGGGQINVAVLTLVEKDGQLIPANLAYRFDEPVAGIYNERNQALALHAGNVDAFTATIDVALLTSGLTQNRVPGPGYHERQFVSGDNISVESEKEQGRLQHYGLYVPTNPDIDLITGEAPLTIWVHYRGGKAHSGGAWTPRLIHQLGEEQGNIVVTPRGRGTSTWYTHWAHQDVFEVFADVAGTDISGADTLPIGHPLIGSAGLFDINPDRVYLSGYSMGGFGTYLFGLLYPDKFAAGFAQSGATTQGAWTGVGPDGPFCPPGANPCFVETNEGKANAQLNWRLLENARHFPITIHHGSNDELVPISGVQRFGEQLLDLGYRYDLTMFLGYEHFTQAIVDEWADGAHYINQFSRPDGDPVTRQSNPRQVTYKVVPALVKSVQELMRGPAAISAPLTHINPDGAYWVDELAVRVGADGSDPTKSGMIEAESEALDGDEIQAIPTSQTSFLPPYLSTPVFSPGNHSTPYVRHGQSWQVMAPLPTANRFRATLTNLSAATLDLERMGLDFTKTIEGTLTNDNPGPDLTIVTLANVGDKMTLCVGNDPGVNVGPGSATGSNPTVELGNGMKGVWLARGHDRICADVIGFTAAPGDAPDYADLCESYGVDPAEPFCGGLRTAEQELVAACDAENTPAGFCTLFGGNLHALLDTCFANNPGEEQLPMCRVMDAFVTGAAAYCRQVSTASGGAQAPELCALMGGVLVSEKALQAYENSGVHKALLLQNKLGYGLPLLHNTLLHTHNSFNATDDNTPPTLSGSDYNQLYDITGQLRMDIRAIEIDVHWMPGRDGTPETGGFEPMVCHADTADNTEDTPFEEDPAGTDHRSPHLGCTVEKPLREVLEELRFWLDQHPSEAVVLYLEDHLTEAGADTDVSYDTTSDVIEETLGDLVYRTGASDCDNADPTSWLKNVTRREIIETGMQVFLISETCNSAGTWNSLVHRKRGDNVRQGTQSSFAGFSYEANCALPDDAMDDGIRIPDQRGVRWSRIWEDSTMVTATAGGGAPAALTPAVTHELMRCGLSLPGFDRLYPADQRLDAAVWSWAKNEPAADAAHANNCAKLNTDGRFEAANCDEERPYACVAGNLADGITDPNDWEIVGSGMWDDGAAACIGVDRLFSVPASGYANEQLKAAAGGAEVWLNYTDDEAEGDWQGHAVGGVALRGTTGFRTAVGLRNAVAAFLAGIVSAVAELADASFDTFAAAISGALDELASNLFAVLVGNGPSSLWSLVQGLMAGVEQMDSDNVARDLLRGLGRIVDGGTSPGAGYLRAGVGVVDMTPDVGYGTGQHGRDGTDRFDGFAGEEMDPFLLHKLKGISYGVQSRLTARAIVVEGANGKRIALVKTDNYLAQDTLVRRVAQILVAGTSGIGYDQILYHVTHDHSSAYNSTPAAGVWAFQDAFDPRFFENQARKMAEAIELAAANLKPARMGAIEVKHTIFKGNVVGPATADDGTPAGYPLEYGDHGLVVMRFDEVDANGEPFDPARPIAVWVNWGEHPESLSGDGLQLHSADFLAPLERFVERDIGAPLVFSQGDVGSSEREGNKSQRLDDEGNVCESSPTDATCQAGGVLRSWNRRTYVQVERNVRYLADSIRDAWLAIGTIPADSTEARKVQLSRAVEVNYVNAWVPGPLSHPYPAVSNCRSQPSYSSDPGSPVLGLPECARASNGFGGPGEIDDSDGGFEDQYEEAYQDFMDAGPGQAFGELATIVGLMHAEGVPIPDHYDAISFGTVEENARLKLQVFQLGDVVLASCACEAQVDLILNLESRLDQEPEVVYDGFDWACYADSNPGDENLRLDTDRTADLLCTKQLGYYSAVEFPTRYEGSFDDSAGHISRMRAQVHNPADGWDAPEYVPFANSEPDRIEDIKGNFTHEEIQDLGATGFRLPVGIGHAGDYNGYTVSYREFMNRDHYRKSLTAYGPHTADYMVTRLVRMAASLRGGDSFVPEAHDAGAQADEARMQGQSLLIGAASARAYDAWVAALPQDVGPVEPIEQPEAIQHFNAATFRWRGGSTQVDNPIVRIEKRCTAGDLVTPSEDAGLATAWVFKNCTAAGAGQWATFADMTGEVQTRAHFPEGFPGAGEVYAGQFTWEWTANFEAYRAFPARLGSTPVGIYRFVVQGCFNDGAGGDADGDGISRCPGRASEYSLSSAEFEVGPGEATPPRSYESPAFAFFIDGSGTSVPCDHCSFRPWEGH